MEKAKRNDKAGLFGAITFHAILIILFILFGYSTPLPLPGEEGIMIDFGAQRAGAGSAENSIQQARPTPTPRPQQQTQQEQGTEETLTQDFEESVAIDSKQESEEQVEKEVIEDKKTDEPEVKETEAEKTEEVVEERKVNEKALFPGRTNDESSTKGNSDSDGNSTTGNAEQAGAKGDSNKGGTGLGDKGVSFSLAGRSPQSLPPPEYTKQVEGKVVVEITVDKSGNVIKAEPGVKGSTTLDEYLLKAAKAAALKAKFDRKPDAPAYQKGTITYNFVLQ